MKCTTLWLAVWVASAAARIPQVPQPPAPPPPILPDIPDAQLVRITTSFEISHTAAVLHQVAKLFSSGFIRRDADALARQIEQLPAEETRSWQFQALYKGMAVPLHVRARLDDFGMLDLDFFTLAAAATPLRTQVDAYLNARGL